MDDTFTIIKKAKRSSFLEHINSIDPNITFSRQETRGDGSMHFLDILKTPKEDGKLSTSLYRKPTHTDLYLQWDSHHTIPSKFSVVGTLYHRAKTICPSPQLLQEEEKHLFQALKRCKDPTWALNRIQLKSQAPTKTKNRSNTNHAGHKNNNNYNVHMVAPYYKGFSESFKRSCKKYGVQVHFKGGLTIKNLLMAPKDKDHILKNQKKVESYTDTNVIGWSVMKSILENQQEHLQRGSRTIRRFLPQYMTTTTPLVILSP